MNDERAANAIDKKIGQRVRTRRLEIGMSQERLAELLGVTFQQVQKYEKGTNRVSASRLFHVAQVLGVPVQYFYEDLPAGAGENGVEGFGESGEQAVITKFLNSSEGLQLNRAFHQITDTDVRRRVVDLVKSIAADKD
jgi:transcriptional regulator with XRE-family HTH domain